MNQDFLSLFAEANDFTKKVLIENMMKNIEFWGNKAASYVHGCDGKLTQAVENDAPDHVIDELQQKLDAATEQLISLRMMYKALKA